MSFARFRIRVAALLAALCSLAVADSHVAEPIKPGEYGKELVAVASIPAAAFLRDAWVGPSRTMDSRKNPYTIVVTVEGKAKADGDVSMLWNTGWQVEGVNKQRPAMGRPVSGVHAGEHVVVRRAGSPNQFEVDKTVSPVVELMRVDNLEVERVDVEIWSGFAKVGWLDWLRSAPIWGFGVVMLVIAWFFTRR